MIRTGLSHAGITHDTKVAVGSVAVVDSVVDFVAGSAAVVVDSVGDYSLVVSFVFSAPFMR